MVEKIQNAWSKPASNYNDAYQRTLRDLDQKAKASEKRRVHRNAVIDAQNKVDAV